MEDLRASPVIRTVGLHGLLVSFGDRMSARANRAAISFRAHVDTLGIEGVQETASTLVSVFVRMDLAEHAPEPATRVLKDALAGRDWFSAPWPGGRRIWSLPAAFDGPDLEAAAEKAGLTAAAARAALEQTTVQVITLGFAPGQPYLGTLGPEWDIPRRQTLAPRVPAGALVVAIRQMCLFAADTPTGWWHVGQTAFRPFQPQAAQPFALSPGDQIRFDPATRTQIERLEAHPMGGATARPLS